MLVFISIDPFNFYLFPLSSRHTEQPVCLLKILFFFFWNVTSPLKCGFASIIPKLKSLRVANARLRQSRILSHLCVTWKFRHLPLCPALLPTICCHWGGGPATQPCHTFACLPACFLSPEMLSSSDRMPSPLSLRRLSRWNHFYSTARMLPQVQAMLSFFVQSRSRSHLPHPPQILSH